MVRAESARGVAGLGRAVQRRVDPFAGGGGSERHAARERGGPRLCLEWRTLLLKYPRRPLIKQMGHQLTVTLPWGESTVRVAVTGWGQDGDRHRTQEAGFDHHLVKPVDPHTLIKMLLGLHGDYEHQLTKIRT